MSMSYSEKELFQVLSRLLILLGSKILSSHNPNRLDTEFITHLRNYISSSNIREEKQLNSSSQLRSFLKRAKDWEKMDTPFPNIYVIKVPLKKQDSAKLRLVISYLKKDIDVRNSLAFQALKEAFNNVHINELVKEIDLINSTRISTK